MDAPRHRHDRSIRSRVEEALVRACRASAPGRLPPVILEKPRREGHGDLSTNLALLVARETGEKGRDVAERIAAALRADAGLCPSVAAKIQIAGGGFINLFLAPGAFHAALALLLGDPERFGEPVLPNPSRILVEFVSANPTGPLTVAHGRQAAVGDSLARILAAAGHRVVREYYLNDRGKQIRLLGLSTWRRYLELFGEKAEIPEDGYRGDYLRLVAERAREREGDRWREAAEEEAVAFFSRFAADEILADIRNDLDGFRVRFDRWTSETEFSATGKIEECLDFLRRNGFVRERDGAVWFESTRFGDDKDRVLVKSDGSRTYFTPDIAYHRDKFGRGFDRVIDLWGPDHHGYIPRMNAAVRALGYAEDRFTPLIVQLTTLFRGREKLSMSTRAGEFVTLREVVDEVGVDAARYFFARMRTDSHLNFDLALAAKRSNDNPVYYVQYVHARICSIFKRLPEKLPGFVLPPWDEAPLERLVQREELDLIGALSEFPYTVGKAADSLEPNLLCNYLEALAAGFHRCYAAHTVISSDAALTAARLALAEGVRAVVRSGLDLLGVSAPEEM
jgi:arginyl-tRNA synthetase